MRARPSTGLGRQHRRCVRDAETLPPHHEAMIYIAMIMTRRVTRTTD
jgi:hypothetical protein